MGRLEGSEFPGDRLHSLICLSAAKVGKNPVNPAEILPGLLQCHDRIGKGWWGVCGDYGLDFLDLEGHRRLNGRQEMLLLDRFKRWDLEGRFPRHQQRIIHGSIGQCLCGSSHY